MTIDDAIRLVQVIFECNIKQYTNNHIFSFKNA